MSDLKRHSPLSLDHDKPDWVNEQGVRWWGLDVGEPQDGIAFRADFPNGDATFGILKDEGVIYETRNLEELCFKFTQLELIRIKR